MMSVIFSNRVHYLIVYLMNELVTCHNFGVSIQVPYFLKYNPGLELNLVSNWTRVNLPIQVLSLDFNPLEISTWVIMDHEIN